MAVRDDLIAIPDAVLREGRIGQAALVFMDFADAPQRWWTGFGNVEAGGFTWQGLGDLISISPIETAYDLSAQQVTFTVAATPEMLARAIDAKARVRDRAVTVSLQLFATEAYGGVARGQPLGSPMVLYVGTMQRMPWSWRGPMQRTITIEAEGMFFRRNAPPRGMWTDSDQRARYPGDIGFERMPLYTNYEVRWL